MVESSIQQDGSGSAANQVMNQAASLLSQMQKIEDQTETLQGNRSGITKSLIQGSVQAAIETTDQLMNAVREQVVVGGDAQNQITTAPTAASLASATISDSLAEAQRASLSNSEQMSLDMLQLVGLISVALLLLVGAFVYHYYRQIKSTSEKSREYTPINLSFSASGDISDQNGLNQQDEERTGLLQQRPNNNNNFQNQKKSFFENISNSMDSGSDLRMIFMQKCKLEDGKTVYKQLSNSNAGLEVQQQQLKEEQVPKFRIPVLSENQQQSKYNKKNKKLMQPMHKPFRDTTNSQMPAELLAEDINTQESSLNYSSMLNQSSSLLTGNASADKLVSNNNETKSPLTKDGIIDMIEEGLRFEASSDEELLDIDNQKITSD